jgi:hypothetical protein
VSDEANKQWMRRHDYPPPFIQAVSRHLYGIPLDEAISKLSRAHMTPHGNTPQGSRRELARMVDNLDQIGSTLIDLWDQMC